MTKALMLAAVMCSGVAAVAQTADAAFAVATIHAAKEPVKFESDGETKVLPGTLVMRDVTIATCIKWAYRVQRAQVVGPGLLTSERYDLTAKADGPATEDEMRVMMQALLAERFGLAFHREKREMKAFALTVVPDSKNGAKAAHPMKAAAADEVPRRENNAMGTVAHALTMAEFADFLGGPVEKPVVDRTGLPGRWDFAFDFTKYMSEPPKGIDDFLLVLNETLQGEIGLKLVAEKDTVDVLVVDSVRKASGN